MTLYILTWVEWNGALKENIISRFLTRKYRLHSVLRQVLYKDEYWERIFVAIENNNIAGHCSLNEKDSVPDVEYTPYIQAVFVNEQFRGKRLSEKLILCAMSYAKTLGFEKVYIVSDHKNFYEKYGFIKIDEGNDYRGELQSIFVQKIQ